MAAKVSRPLVYGALAVIAVVGWIMTSPKSDQGNGAALKANRQSLGKRQAQSSFDESDLNARFERLNEAPRNAFRPLVAKSESGAGGVLAPNEFPASVTGGEAGWFYTGTTIVDDVPSALVENQLSGEGRFLMVGENLNKAVIAQIAPTYIVVIGTSGQALRLNLLEDSAESEERPANLGFEPVRPNLPDALRGPIGATSGIP